MAGGDLSKLIDLSPQIYADLRRSKKTIIRSAFNLRKSAAKDFGLLRDMDLPAMGFSSEVNFIISGVAEINFVRHTKTHARMRTTVQAAPPSRP
jgi:hypothetical protein